jgi:hypothetical protein
LTVLPILPGHVGLPFPVMDFVPCCSVDGGVSKFTGQ